MNAKKYCIAISTIFLVFIITNIIIWHYGTKNSFGIGKGHGDLGRIAGLHITDPNTHPINYLIKHREFQDVMDNTDDIKADVLTIGDSFSNGGGGNYYQDYLCSKYNWSILNVPSKPYNNALQILYILEESGLLAQIQPKVVILESLSANMKYRFGMESPQIPKIDIDGFKQAQKCSLTTEQTERELFYEKIVPGIMLKANLSYIEAWAYRRMNPNDYHLNEGVGMMNLNRAFFSNPGWEDKLVFPFSDANVHYDEKTLDNIVNNINGAADLCKKHDIELVFMPVENKFDVYYPYIVDPPPQYTESMVLRDMSNLPHRFIMINTSDVLRKKLESDDKEEYIDLFWVDDLHYSWKAHEAIAEQLQYQLRDLLAK